MSHADLLNRYVTVRDAEAFAQIVEQYQRLVFATCRRVLRDPNNIDDATQEIFLRLAKKAGARQINLGAWLHRCAMNVAIDFNRRQATRLRHEAAAARLGEMMDQSQRELAELREHLDAALEKLNEEERELIIQRFFTGRPQIELAAEAGVSPATMSYRMEQAIDRLRKHFEAMSGAAIGGEVWMKLLESEHASAMVPAKLTADLMKIGLSAPPVVATVGTAAPTKMVIAAIALFALFFGSWKLIRRDTAAPKSPSLPVISIGNNAETPRWQTTQPSVRAVLAGRILDDANHGIASAIVRLDSIPSGFDAAIRTDANGNYEFNWIPRAETFRMGVSADGFVPIGYDQSGPEVELTPVSQARRDFVMQRGEPVTVTIDTPLDEPIAKAFVVAFQHNNNPSITADTDDMGRAEIMLPRSPEVYTVAVQAAGYAPTHAEITDSMSAVSTSLSWRMLPGKTIHGIAMCSDRKPPAGETIVATPEWWMGMFMPHSEPIDVGGNFTLHDMGPGRYRLMIGNIQDFVIVSMPPVGNPMRVEFPFPSPGSVPELKGMVTFAGGRPGDHDVKAWAMSVTSEEGHLVEGLKQYFTWVSQPAAGQQTVMVNFGRVPPGKYLLQFRGDDLETKYVQDITVPGVLPPITLNIIGVAVMTGNVVDAETGKPVTQFAVRAREFPWQDGQPSAPLGKGEWTQVSNADGRFSLTLNGPGSYQTEVSAENYRTETGEKAQVSPGAMIARVIVKLNHAK